MVEFLSKTIDIPIFLVHNDRKNITDNSNHEIKENYHDDHLVKQPNQVNHYQDNLV